MPRHYEDFTGKEINGLYVKKLVSNSGGATKHKKWICECMLCHNEVIIQSNHLKDRKTLYCSECIKTKRENLVGQRFGHLIVDSMIDSDKCKRTKCLCTCDCGATCIEVQANHIKEGLVRSCGCVLSYGEEEIANLLTKNNIVFEKQKSFPDLKYKNLLRYDFYLPDNNLVIEYNGKQHYKPIKYYGGEESFIISQERDRIKKEYCLNNNIGYLVIRYDENIKQSLIMNNII